ncbi:Cupin 2 conserved barrel [Penicillium vulpinum]|uniref:Cupin 2 conserved barrel n=1 Tax=Penicillium vulpinum TaxID=29845 RepID=UPI002548B44B|nr:Cupin 2 conserved barrel [Penicillium vulpinum]KAJ5964966.1 Cupin 2 conserved barrel [Penicillium vulpinum]
MSSNTSQVSDLPPFARHITGHNEAGRAVIHSSNTDRWVSLEATKMAFNVIYTTQFPPDLNNDADLKGHEALMESKGLGLVNTGGTVCRIVDFAPDNVVVVHRTQSLDYGVVIEGQVEMIVEDSDPVIMNRGDVVVQRATMHGWRNTSKTEWARLMFVLQDCKPLSVAGKELGEELGLAAGEIPSSNA